jgi:hypothetical protein
MRVICQRSRGRILFGMNSGQLTVVGVGIDRSYELVVDVSLYSGWQVSSFPALLYVFAASSA